MSADRVSQLQDQLDRASARLESMRKHAVVARGSSEAATPGGLTGYDPAVLSGIRRKSNRVADERRFNAYDREAQASAHVAAQERTVEILEAKLNEAIRDVVRARFTRDDLVGAFAVRDRFGWHKVARVNAKTVSVETGYSWVDRIGLDKILEVRMP